MKISNPIRISYTCEVDEKVCKGDVYEDPRGHQWRIWDVRPFSGIRFDMEWMPVCEIVLQSDHPSYKIGNGEPLIPYETSREGKEWQGKIEHKRGVAFGELWVGDKNLSWCARQEKNECVFMIGPFVPYYNYFDNPIESSIRKFDKLSWENIIPAIEEFQYPFQEEDCKASFDAACAGDII
jgi:hypothetical protein